MKMFFHYLSKCQPRPFSASHDFLALDGHDLLVLKAQNVECPNPGYPAPNVQAQGRTVRQEQNHF